MQAMLLAAGFGTRLRPYTLVHPKPLFPILNRPLLLILLDMLKQAGCTRIVVNGHHLATQIEQTIADRKGVSYQYEPIILGTGGSLRQALPNFTNEPVLIINSDVFHTIDLAALYHHHIHSGNRITMAMHDYPRFNTVGVNNNHVQAFHSTTQQECLAFTGIHVVDPSIINMIPSQGFFHIIDLYEKLIQQGEKIGCKRVDQSFWQDIGTLDDYLELHATLLSGRIKNPLQVSIPNDQWLINSDTHVQDGVQLTGWGCIGKADIGHDIHLHNCVVWDDAQIPDGLRLENTIISPGVEL